jgi:DNA-directed RNA polymerase subunit H (RpoH/RPB5)
MSQKVTRTELNRTEAAILDFIIENPTATHSTIARSLNVSREHVTRLLNTDPLAERIRTIHGEIFRIAQERASLSSLRMVLALQSIALDASARKADRIRAARVVLEFAREGERHEPEHRFDASVEAANAIIEAHRERREALRQKQLVTVSESSSVQ